jgi:hypothetical protein
LQLLKMKSATRSEIMLRPFAARRCESYRDLIAAIDERRQDLRLPMIELDEIAGLYTGYAAKLICMTKSLGPLSLGLMLEALGLQITVSSREAV